MVFAKLSTYLWKILGGLSKMVMSLEDHVPVSRKMCSLCVFEGFRSLQRPQRRLKTTLMFSWWSALRSQRLQFVSFNRERRQFSKRCVSTTPLWPTSFLLITFRFSAGPSRWGDGQFYILVYWFISKTTLTSVDFVCFVNIAKLCDILLHLPML